MTEMEAYGSGRKAVIPSSWAEMSPRQVQAVFRIHADCLRKGASPLEFNVRVLYRLLGIRPGWRAAVVPGRIAENVYRLCERCLGFLLTEEDGTPRLTYDSTANPLPRCGRRHGPADLLQDLTFGEFRHAAMAAQAFLKGHDTADLDECIGILYRRRSWKANRAGRHAAPLGGPSFRRDVRAASRMAPWKKNLVLLWFCSCLKTLQTGRLAINGEEVDLSLLFQEDGPSQGPACTWNDLLVRIAKDQTVGNIDRVDEEPLFSVLALMWSNYKEAKRYEETAKTHKGK